MIIVIKVTETGFLHFGQEFIGIYRLWTARDCSGPVRKGFSLLVGYDSPHPVIIITTSVANKIAVNGQSGVSVGESDKRAIRVFRALNFVCGRRIVGFIPNKINSQLSGKNAEIPNRFNFWV